MSISIGFNIFFIFGHKLCIITVAEGKRETSKCECKLSCFDTGKTMNSAAGVQIPGIFRRVLCSCANRPECNATTSGLFRMKSFGPVNIIRFWIIPCSADIERDHRDLSMGSLWNLFEIINDPITVLVQIKIRTMIESLAVMA